MGRFERSLSLFKSSWSVVQTDRELLALPVISALVNIVVMASFAVPAWFSLEETRTVAYEGATATTSMSPTIATYLIGAAFYFVTAFVVIFFNAALVVGANERFEGGNPTLGSAIAGARSRLGLILQWAAVSATVSMVIRQVQERGGLFGRIIGGLIGFAWAVVTFLVLPMLVIEGVGVREAFRRSTEAVRTTWGENLIGQGGMGLVGFLAVLPCVAVGVVGGFLATVSLVPGILLIATAVIALLGVMVVMSAMGVIYQTALYRFTIQRPVLGFEPTALQSAFAPRKGRFV